MPRGNPGINIGMRVPTRTVEAVDAWAAKHDLSRMAAFKTIMQAGLDRLGIRVER